MGKKGFAESAAHLDKFFSDTGTHRTQGTQGTQGTQAPTQLEEPKHYRINLKLKAEFREYLDRVAWEDHKSITQYINDLIEEDRYTRDTEDT